MGYFDCGGCFINEDNFVVLVELVGIVFYVVV